MENRGDRHVGGMGDLSGFDGLDQVLASVDQGVPEPGAPLRLDHGRLARKGVPEVILAERKRPEHALAAAREFVERTGRALLSRVDPALMVALGEAMADCQVEAHAASRMVVVKRADYQTQRTDGRVGVISDGTSDVPVAEEAAVIAAEMGCKVEVAYDVGVAGLHRLAEPLRRLGRLRADAIVIAAGMDGALPSVMAGLVDVPVIGLPTSIGYGACGRGVAALLSMPQSCAPGLLVVNIDNGIGAEASAALIANRMAAARASDPRRG